MTSWPRRARFGIAVFGIAFAGFVYWSVRERQTVSPPAPVERLDPKAVLETTAGEREQVRGDEREFEITWSRSVAYEDESARLWDVVITVRRPDGRIFVITASEALAGPKQVHLQLTGQVKLSDNDGFTLLTDRATFDRDESVARVAGAVTFEKGRMSGSGLGATYDQRNDVLAIAQRAVVTMVDEAGRPTLDANAGSATLDRLQDVLVLDSMVRLLRGAEVMEADHMRARLSPGEEVITYLELRGKSSVHGGEGPIESMRASAVDLDYRDDGQSLERVILSGDANVVMAAEEQATGRRMSGESLDLQLAADGTLTSLVGRGKVRFDLPGAGRTAGRSILAGSLDAGGEPTRGLTDARFRDDVVYREEGNADRPAREGRSQSLDLVLDDDAVTSALFTNGVTFDEQGLRATAAEASYRPAKNLLSLVGAGGRGEPRVTDNRIRVDAHSIDVTLDGHAMTARGNVRTSLQGRAPTGPQGTGEGRLPGLLDEGRPASINAESLDYSGGAGRAVYSGGATLLQGETAIRGDVIDIDQQKGDLIVTGSARSTLMLDAGRTDGQADEIRYDEATRVVTYGVAPIAPTRGGGVGSITAKPRPAGQRLARLSGPQGDLRARRIVVSLARAGNQVERLEGYDEVTMIQGDRMAVGTRLTYHADDERYVMSGRPGAPVTIRATIRDSCRETRGQTLTFFKSKDEIVVDSDAAGHTDQRPCAPAPSR